jgi:hypothetical protein
LLFGGTVHIGWLRLEIIAYYIRAALMVSSEKSEIIAADAASTRPQAA